MSSRTFIGLSLVWNLAISLIQSFILLSDKLQVLGDLNDFDYKDLSKSLVMSHCVPREHYSSWEIQITIDIQCRQLLFLP